MVTIGVFFGDEGIEKSPDVGFGNAAVDVHNDHPIFG